ncbi:MAG TPA: tape measure protein [Tepidisphaeraceae bacterium]|jgi:tape measure domain-containing protein
MTWDAGAIVGKLALDTTQYDKPLAQATVSAVSGAKKLEESLGKPFAPAAAEVGKLTYATNASVGSAVRLAESVSKVRPDAIRMATAATGELRSGLNLASIAGGTLGSALGNVGANLVTGGIRAVSNAITGFIGDSLKAAASFEQTGISFEVMLGSGDKARKLMQEITAFAAATPFELPQLTDASRKLLAFGFAGEQVVPTLRRVGDLSAGLGIPIGDLAEIYGKARVQGRLFMEDMNQLTGRGIPITAELAKQFRVTEGEVRDLVEQGRVGFPELERAVADLTGAGGKFNDMMRRQSASASGLYSTLKDAFGEMDRQFGKALIDGANGKSLLEGITEAVQDLTPAVVSLGLSLADAFRNALPYIKSAATYLEAGFVLHGTTDPNAKAGNPMQGPGNANAVGQIYGDSKGIEEAQRLLNAYVNSVTAASEGIEKIYAARGDYNNPALRDEAKRLRDEAANTLNAVQSTYALLAQLKTATEKNDGNPVDPQKLEAAKKALGQLVDLYERQRAVVSRGLATISGVSDEKITEAVADSQRVAVARLNGVQALLDRLRAEYAGAQRSAEEAKKNDAAPSTPAASGASSSPTTPKPAGRAGNAVGSTGGDRAGASVDALRFEAEEARLAAAGKVDQLERLRLDRWLAEQNDKAKNGEQMMAITLAYGAKLAALQSEQHAKAKEREAARASATVDATAAVLESQGRQEEADLLRFDAAWNKKLEIVADREQRMTMLIQYEAERRRSS